MEFAMVDAVSKIDQKPDTHPDQQPEPGIKRKGDHLCQADSCTKYRDQGYPWGSDRIPNHYFSGGECYIFKIYM